MYFGTMRLKARAELHRGMFTRHDNPRPCVWQDYSPSRHDAVYCNVLSHLETLDDLLTRGTWCDDITLHREFRDDDDCMRLFRYYGLVFLGFDQCIADLRTLVTVATGSKKQQKLDARIESYMGFINSV